MTKSVSNLVIIMSVCGLRINQNFLIHGKGTIMTYDGPIVNIRLLHKRQTCKTLLAGYAGYSIWFHLHNISIEWPLYCSSNNSVTGHSVCECEVEI